MTPHVGGGVRNSRADALGEGRNYPDLPSGPGAGLAISLGVDDYSAGSGIVGQQEAEPSLGQQMLGDGDPLMRQGSDQSRFHGKSRIEQITER